MMKVDQLAQWLEDNHLTKFNFHQIYTHVFKINQQLSDLGLENLMFAGTHLEGAMYHETPLSEDFFKLVIKDLVDQNIFEIEVNWMKHAKELCGRES